MAADSGSSQVGMVAGPGDAVQQLPESGAVRIGGGLRTQDGCVVANKCGIVRQTRNGTLWLEGRQKRYIPVAEDLVVGIVTDRRGEHFVVDVGAPFPAQLPQLAFEGATRRNRPSLVAGDLVYARVTAANHDTDPLLTCMDAAGRAAGFGPLTGGIAIEAPLPYCRSLLAQPPGPALTALAASKIRFELAVGLNGRLWVNAADVATTAAVARALGGAAGVPGEQQAAWVADQLKQHAAAA